MNPRMTPIATAVAIAIASTVFAAQAQQAADAAKPAETKVADAPPADAKAPQKLDTVTVTGIRGSLQQSLTTKRNADSIVQVITAEDIGKMPDKNVADSLQRLPGVTTTTAGSAEGSFGENEHVQLRGLSSQLTLTTLNGHAVSTGDWYGPNIQNGGRSVTFTLLPSDLVGRATVNTSQHADLIEGGAAGSVDIETRKPLDFKSGLTSAFSLETAYSSAAKKYDPSLSALLNWKNEDGSMGVLGQVFSQTHRLQRAGSEGVWWDKVPDAYTGDPSLRGKAVSYLTGATLFEQTRKRDGAFLDLQWKPQSNITLDLSGFYSTVSAKNTNTNYMAYTYNAFNNDMGGGQVGVAPTTAPTFSNGGQTISSIFFGANAFGGNNDGAYSVVEDVAARPDAKTDSKFINLDGKWVVNDKLTMTSKVGTTKGGGLTHDVGFEVLSGWNQGAGYSTGSNGILVLNVPGGDKFVKTGAGIGGWGSYTSATDSESYGQVDGTLQTDMAMVPSLKFGARAARHRHQLTQINITLADGAADESNIPDSAIGNYPANWQGNLPTNPTPGLSPFKISQPYVASWIAKYGSFTEHAVQQEFDIKENTTAAYAMANLTLSERITGDAGVRIVHTNENIAAYLPGGAPTYEQGFTNALPSLNLRTELSKDLIARFALSRGLSRPDFGQLAGNVLDDTAHRGSAGYPFLKPMRANNIDATMEWYFTPRSLLSVGLFYSKLQGAISYRSATLEYVDAGAKNPGTPVTCKTDSVHAAVNSHLAPNGIDCLSDYTVSSPVNVDGEMKGISIAFQHALGAGFGVEANFTHADGKQTTKLVDGTCNGSATEDCTLYGSSKQSYNLSGYYENEKFSARVTYSYRDSNKLGNRGGSDYFEGSSGSLGVALNYNLSKSAQLSFEAQNLNDPLQTTYVNDKTQIAGVYKNGKTLYAGLRMKF